MNNKLRTMNYELLKVDNLKTYFPIKKGLLRRTVGYVKAVDGISFGIRAGQSLGLVGESGCGKTTVARSLIRLIRPTEGRVVFDGTDVLSAGRVKLRQLRRKISLIFQDPFSSLNPRMTVGNIIAEPLKVHRKWQMENGKKREATGDKRFAIGDKRLVTGDKRVAVLLSKVGLSPDHINRYPHEFSGGQRQRIGLARALAMEPKLVICDEPVSALDVSIQSQILNLLKDLQEEFGLTFLFIAHDLAVVQFFCDVVAVMYMGRIVEQATAEELYRNPLHPYTRALMSAIPRANRKSQMANSKWQITTGDKRFAIGDKRFATGDLRLATGGEVPSALNPPTGCPFHPRCPWRQRDCLKQNPALEKKSGCRVHALRGPCEEHFVACWKC